MLDFRTLALKGYGGLLRPQRAGVVFRLEEGKGQGWQDLMDLLPAAWRRKEESHLHLAVYAAAHYYQAGRPRIALRWSQPPFHQTLKGADLFRAFAAWLAAPERWKQHKAERLLERLVEHQDLGVWQLEAAP